VIILFNKLNIFIYFLAMIKGNSSDGNGDNELIPGGKIKQDIDENIKVNK
jgi:hypothetical protein